MSTTYTAGKVRELVAANHESELPETVLDVLRRESGKRLTSRLLDKLPGGATEWHISHVANMTHLETASYSLSLLLAYATTNVTIDAKWVEERNPAHFSARRERNAKRLEAGNDADLCWDMANALNAVIAARKVLAAAESRLEQLTSYPDGPFESDRHVWKALTEAS